MSIERFPPLYCKKCGEEVAIGDTCHACLTNEHVDGMLHNKIAMRKQKLEPGHFLPKTQSNPPMPTVHMLKGNNALKCNHCGTIVFATTYSGKTVCPACGSTDICETYFDLMKGER